PRICNHCLNPGCVAACPQGAIYKRGEDGVVLVSQERCRAWRMCVSGCPYKKTYFNWSTGKAEKCILCYPRLESGQPPACFHSCVGRIRYIGLLLYVRPLGPVVAKTGNGVYDNVAAEARLGPLMSSLERSRISMRYMASLLTGGNEQIIRDVYRKLVAVRVFMRAKKVGDIPADE